jgi:hypothetical protein
MSGHVEGRRNTRLAAGPLRPAGDLGSGRREPPPHEGARDRDGADDHPPRHRRAECGSGRDEEGHERDGDAEAAPPREPPRADLVDEPRELDGDEPDTAEDEEDDEQFAGHAATSPAFSAALRAR